jgi:hypothetical protein
MQEKLKPSARSRLQMQKIKMFNVLPRRKMLALAYGGYGKSQ